MGFRGRTVAGPWASAVGENFYERVDPDPGVAQVWCYSDRMSYAPGETARLHVAATTPWVEVEIRRDGTGERLLGPTRVAGHWPSTPEDCSEVGCGWPPMLEVAIPHDARSGGYVVTCRAEGARPQHHLLLIGGRAEARAPILLLCATATWLAYNDWGGSNHYEGITGPGRNLFAPVVSRERPWSRGFVRLPVGAPRIMPEHPPAPGAVPRYPHMEWAYATGHSKKYASAGWASYERHFMAWADAEGLAVDVAAQHDLHDRPDLLDAYACVVIVGHDEYWSWQMRDHLEAYLERGGRLARFGANFYWQIRLEDGGRRQVCYKYRARAEDSVADRRRLTTAWDAREIGRPAAATMGLTGARGVYAGWGGCAPRGAGGFTVYRPEHWAFAGADLHYGDVLGAASRAFGYEVDGCDYGFRHGLPYATGEDGAPRDLEILAMAPATLLEEDPSGHVPAGRADPFIGDLDLIEVVEAVDGRDTPEGRERLWRGAGMIAEHRRGAGALFNAASCEWVAGLLRRDPQIMAVTRTVLERYGRR